MRGGCDGGPERSAAGRSELQQVRNRHARMPCPNLFFRRTLRWLGEVDVEKVGDLVGEIEGLRPRLPCARAEPNQLSAEPSVEIHAAASSGWREQLPPRRPAAPTRFYLAHAEQSSALGKFA